MPLWFILVVLVALYFATKRGAAYAGRSIAAAYRGGKADSAAKRAARHSLTRDAVDAGHGEGARKAAATVGAAVGATVSGTRVHAHAARRGWLEGWREGRDKVLRRRASGTDFVPDATHSTAPDGIERPKKTKKVKPAKCLAIVSLHLPDGGIRQRRCGVRYMPTRNADGTMSTDCGFHTPDAGFAPPLRERGVDPVPTPDPLPFPDSTTLSDPVPAPTESPEKEEPMPETKPTETPTPTPAPPAVPSGEVNTMSQLMAELERIQKEATAELDDAQSDAARATSDLEDANADLALAKAEAAAIDVMVGCLGRPELKLDPESIGDVMALTDGSQQRATLAASRADAASVRLTLATNRAQVADARLAAATKAHDNIKARHQVYLEAAQASPVAVADARFYE